MGDERKRRRENSREPPGYDPDTFDWEVRAHGLCPLPTHAHSARPRSAPSEEFHPNRVFPEY